MTESIDPAILLDTNESVEWSGRPRITTILPAVVIGVLLPRLRNRGQCY